ncbi:hypothetical protein [Solilutibacter pythonis]|uniref:hypothetical protein n=1 Tax=Solilutibacter pythonis TaxID=2483112 RepID=UPI0011C47955|nr:hypothetical protein [Lysobacter pythonis]
MAMINMFPISGEEMVVTSDFVTARGMPVLLVTRELDEDGDEIWQFHCDNGDYSMDHMRLVRLDTILKLDSSVGDIENLDVGCQARRQSIEYPWFIEKIPTDS